ncbi:thiamine-phosphate kinase [Agromyces ramosus]|uniref:Thiamine-monophosphate kinase n=1 Tax=Agromyces ramosus TaxID=33879 RepID=A0A4Q7MD31_9MICO|nr:thiamine-phosphate kinase [Agromyces ramosus]RZS65996.1 thiamine-phosphate kinase [Agromyces ramosus]
MERAAHPGDPTIAELGESAVLGRILPRLAPGDAALLGAGDDAAVVAAADGRFVVTTDLLVHGPDFRLAWSTPFDLGWKAAATNLTDVAAMGARPTALVVAIAVPPTMPVTVLEGIADGLREGLAALAPGAGVVGGDLSASTVLTIAVTAFGDLEGRAPVLRSGAVPGDVVAHAGARGDAARGLALLFDAGTDAAGEPDPVRAADVRAQYPRLVGAQLAPQPPVSAGVAAARAGATAMLDVSDGLARDARRIAEASGVDLDFVGAALGPDLRVALAGAEDHGLLATFPAGASVPEPFEVVGSVVAGTGGVLVDGRPVGSDGWDPYSGWDGRAG